ncbi:hypothetical protein E2542_SST08778 [Spatholobus suberectus]|nr:hypothetical protein E2542_SST08778 [Spatholobus suberectus]
MLCNSMLFFMQPIPFFSSHFYVIEGYLSNDESPKQREKPDMSIFKNAVQDCFSYDPPKVHKPSIHSMCSGFCNNYARWIEILKDLKNMQEQARNSLHYHKVNDDSPIVQVCKLCKCPLEGYFTSRPALKDYARLMSGPSNSMAYSRSRASSVLDGFTLNPLPYPILLILALIFIFLCISWYFSHEEVVETAKEQLGWVLFATPMVLILIVCWLSSMENSDWFNGLLSWERRRKTSQSPLEMSSPWGVAALI